jgi:uncharacterized protein
VTHLRRIADGPMADLFGGLQAGLWQETLATSGPLSEGAIERLYTTDWMTGIIVDAPADDATRKWRVWKGSSAQVTAIDAAEKALGLRQKVNAAIKKARAFGGAAIVIGTMRDDDVSEPLDPMSIGRGDLAFVHVLSRWEISTGPLERDPLSPHYLEPQWYVIGSSQAEGAQRIHPSRVIRIRGILPLIESYDQWGWGHSIVQRTAQAVRNAQSALDNGAALIAEAKIDVVQIPELSNRATSPAFQAAMMSRFGLVRQNKQTNSMLILDSNETYTQKQTRFTGVEHIIQTYLQATAAAAGIPVTKFLGRSPAGMNATGKSDLENYYTMVGDIQQDLGAEMARLDALLFRHATGRTPRVDYDWVPLWEASDEERAAVNLQRAQTMQVWRGTGLVPDEALAKSAQAYLIEEGTFPGLAEALALIPEPQRYAVAPAAAPNPPSPSDRVAQDAPG